MLGLVSSFPDPCTVVAVLVNLQVYSDQRFLFWCSHSPEEDYFRPMHKVRSSHKCHCRHPHQAGRWQLWPADGVEEWSR